MLLYYTNIVLFQFYNILKSVHKFFMEQSLKYIVDYINPKVIQVQELTEENINLKIDIDSRVLDNDDQPIRGLYAAGEIVGGIFYHKLE